MPKQTKGFTIIELLTVMSIIIILMSVLVPALSRTRRYAKTVTQRAQFHEISKGLELFRNDHSDTLPDSGPIDTAPTPAGYCGAMKMCEALVGQDGMGFHPSSRFLADPTVAGTIPDIYRFDLCTETSSADIVANPTLAANLRERIKYVDSDNIKAVRLRNLFAPGWTFSGVQNNCAPQGAFNETLRNAVITDVFLRATIQAGTPPIGCDDRAGQKAGMPVLYYKADPSKLSHDAVKTPPDCPSPNIYNYDDNYAITALGCPWESTRATEHPMYLPNPPGPLVFLDAITNKKVTSTPRPHNEDGYILISAGWDGLYGTRDDVFNFAD
jgi:type II secretory pathway pseudopilin PulG